MTDLAKLVVRLEAQSAQLLTELEKANRRIDRFAAQTTKTLQKWTGGLLAAFSARALIQFGNQVLQTQGALTDMAQKAGTSVESLSRLGYAAGSDITALETGLLQLSKTSVAAANGSDQAAKAFAAMGISATNANGQVKATDQLLLEIAESFAQHADGAEKAALAQQLFGKSGAQLIPLLNKGAAGIDELTKKADALGITVSTQAAEAASRFNDAMSTLGQVTRGVVGRALAEITPILAGFAEDMTNSAAGADRLNDASRILAAGLKLLLSAGVVVGEVFDRLGDAIGAAAAALVAVAQGEFRRAWDIMNANSEEAAVSAQQAADDLYRIWSGAGEKIVNAAKDTDAKLKDTFSFGGKSPLEEVAVTVQRLDLSPMEKFYQELDQLTQTSKEKALAAVAEQQVALEELAASQRITDEQYRQRQEEINKARNDALGITKLEEEAEARRQKLFDEGRSIFEATRTPMEQYEAQLVRLNLLLQQGAIDQETYARAVGQTQDELDKASGKMTDFAAQMRRNVQDILGQGLVDIVKGSTSDILQTFSDMILKLVAQAIAADLAGKLFGSGQGGDNGLVGTALGALGSMFGGSRDSGGRGRPGMAYAIGTGAQPEVYIPDQPGTFVPADRLGGRNTINFNISTPDGRVPLETQQQIATRTMQALSRAGRRNG